MYIYDIAIFMELFEFLMCSCLTQLCYNSTGKAHYSQRLNCSCFSISIERLYYR